MAEKTPTANHVPFLYVGAAVVLPVSANKEDIDQCSSQAGNGPYLDGLLQGFNHVIREEAHKRHGVSQWAQHRLHAQIVAVSACPRQAKLTVLAMSQQGKEENCHSQHGHAHQRSSACTGRCRRHVHVRLTNTAGNITTGKRRGTVKAGLQVGVIGC